MTRPPSQRPGPHRPASHRPAPHRPALSLGPAPRRARGESVVPMINIVFLLLVFFMLSATIAPPEPLPVSPPAAEGGLDGDTGAPVLHVGAQGALAFDGLEGEAALAAAAAAGRLVLRADAGLEGAALAALLARLAAAGLASAELVVVRP